MIKSNRAITGIEIGVVVAIIGAMAVFFTSKIHIPFLKTKADVQQELNVEKKAHELTQSELKSANQLTTEDKKLLADLNEGARRQAVLAQSAANANARVTATFELFPASGRKEIVIDYASQEVAKALPAPTNYPEILKATRDQLDEAKISNAQLVAQHASDLTLIDTQQQALAVAQHAIQLQQEKVDLQARANEAQRLANEQQLQEIGAKTSALQVVLDALSKLKFGLMGLVGLAGIICIGAGFFLKNAILSAKGVILVILASVGTWIPLMWYLGTIGLVLLAGGGYIIAQWHKEKTVGENAVGILQETRQKVPEVWTNTIQPIAVSYWGQSVQDVAKAQKWVEQKLDALNFLPKK